MRRVIVFHKPYGVVSQFTPLAGHPTLADFGFPKNIYPAGRLDHDSEGLIILTDDGALSRRLTDPRFKHPRTYLAQVEKIPTVAGLKKLSTGIVLKDGPTLPCKARLLSAEPDLPPRIPPIRHRLTVPTAWIEITLTEGRNRQVRRMTAAIGHPTLRLVRVSSGALSLQGLKPGVWRDVTREEEAFL